MLGTAALALAIAVVALTVPELIAGGAIGKGGESTTFFGKKNKKSDTTKDKNEQAPATETTEEPETETEDTSTTEEPAEEPATRGDNDHAAGRAVANGDHTGSTAHPALAGRLGTPERSPHVCRA